MIKRPFNFLLYNIEEEQYYFYNKQIFILSVQLIRFLMLLKFRNCESATSEFAICSPNNIRTILFKISIMSPDDF